ncbi:MAG: 1-deoxy-D-xylulose-5-phosphate reductoisomerase [Candidatus Glassbacteria bacterium]|nr:1-deoxy-D-xylulose-5-phosphate reductoisomerase [Candidatus Glassbacteria bacterium]
MAKTISILGATGSIGRSCLSVVAEQGNRYEVLGLAARRSAEKLLDAARECGAGLICLGDPDYAVRLDKASLNGITCKTGTAALEELATHPEVDIVVNAMVGSAGLGPSVAALRAGKRLALANKESLVMAGEHLMKLAQETPGAEIIPIDSEHSALFQLIEGHKEGGGLERVVITASGGPFRGLGRERLESVRYLDSLKHPTWAMGPKITVDSATLANKGLEVIEAHYLFALGYDQIDVIVHPQSIVHGMAVFGDGAVMAHLGVPDMRIPIQYALSYPERLSNEIDIPDFADLASLEFERVDNENFPCLELAYQAGRTGGVAPAVFNAANEVAVDLFSRDRIGFMGIPRVIERTLADTPSSPDPSLEDICEADRWARRRAGECE